MMKTRFISVSTKLFALVFTALLMLSLAIATLSISRLNDELKQYQINTLRQGSGQFDLQLRIVQQQLRTWLESFTDIVQLKKHTDFTLVSQSLQQQFDALQINYNVENIWLVNADLTPLYLSDELTDEVVASIHRVVKSNEPDYQLYCHAHCEQLLTLPILNGRGEMAIVTLAISLVDVIYAINQTLENDIAIVGFNKSPTNHLRDAKVLSASSPKLIKALFLEQVSDVSLVDIRRHGLLLDYSDSSYLVNLLPLSSSAQLDFYLAQIDDVSSFIEKHHQYRRQFLLSALAIFLSLAFLVRFFARPFTTRLLVLSDVLPLLAKKEFNNFRKVKIIEPTHFPDELDVLANSALELSFELEQLNLAVSQKTQELENIAMYDLLTGLPNRNMLNYQLRKLFTKYQHGAGHVAILFLDLDDFKKVNDSHGHSDGDKLLIEAASRLNYNVRPIDSVCRFGGDEFVVLLGDSASLVEAERVAEAVLKSFQLPIKINSSLFYVTCSIGIAIGDDKDLNADDLISHADIAMYEAKDNGGDQYHVYHGDMFLRVSHRVMMEGEVRQALEKNQFSLSLQPQIAAKTNKIYGFEALLRWHHPERGMVSPDDFIPILENSEHMNELGYWVIRRCFELFRELKATGLNDIRIAINLSAGQFADVNLASYLQAMLLEFDLSAENFELELTEQTLVKDIDKAIATMELLRRIGFSFAIDDFGTGYSSLAYLKRMPVDVIKIDKSFIFGMLENHADFQIIMSTIAMVKNLGLTVIAEGVETKAQLRSLTENECDLIQGYYFSKPIPEVELFAFISKQVVDGIWRTPD